MENGGSQGQWKLKIVPQFGISTTVAALCREGAIVADLKNQPMLWWVNRRDCGRLVGGRTKATWCGAKAGSKQEASNTARCLLAFSFSEHVLKTLETHADNMLSALGQEEKRMWQTAQQMGSEVTAVVCMDNTIPAWSWTWISHALSSLQPAVNLTRHGVIWGAPAGALALPYWPEGMSMSISRLLDDVGGPCLLQLVPPLGKCSWVI